MSVVVAAPSSMISAMASPVAGAFSMPQQLCPAPATHIPNCAAAAHSPMQADTFAICVSLKLHHMMAGWTHGWTYD